VLQKEILGFFLFFRMSLV